MKMLEYINEVYDALTTLEEFCQKERKLNGGKCTNCPIKDNFNEHHCLLVFDVHGSKCTVSDAVEQCKSNIDWKSKNALVGEQKGEKMTDNFEYVNEVYNAIETLRSFCHHRQQPETNWCEPFGCNFYSEEDKCCKLLQFKKIEDAMKYARNNIDDRLSRLWNFDNEKVE